jgi:hypothetical protein
MDGDAADEPITHVWRMSASRQAQFLLIALILAGIGPIMGGGAILYPGLRDYRYHSDHCCMHRGDVVGSVSA